MQRLEGWTLVETLIGMTIVFVLSGTVGFAGARQLERAYEVSAAMQQRAYELALEAYMIDCGSYPTTAQGLDALWQPPAIAPVPVGWNGPYLQDEPTDTPWGTPYEYRSPGDRGLPYTISFERPAR